MDLNTKNHDKLIHIENLTKILLVIHSLFHRCVSVNDVEMNYDAESFDHNHHTYIQMVFPLYEYDDDFDMLPAVQNYVHNPR